MAARRGRQSYQMSETHREKIRNSNILNALIEHTEGRREMLPSQVTAGLGLLKKVMPDLAAMEHSGEVTVRNANELTDDELATIAAGGRARAAEAPRDPRQLN